MPNDALDPGDGTYPHWPRRPDGSPDPERMPQGVTRQRGPDGKVRVIDLTSYDRETGKPIVPPTLPPE